jgi:hypothetical protein
MSCDNHEADALPTRSLPEVAKALAGWLDRLSVPAPGTATEWLSRVKIPEPDDD